MDEFVASNCYDAGGLVEWASSAGIEATCLRGAQGEVFIRGLIFSPALDYFFFRERCPHYFRLRPMIGGDGGLARCTSDELEAMRARVMELTTPKWKEVARMILPGIGDLVEVAEHPLLSGQRGEVERVSPNTGNVRLIIKGKFWTLPWQFLKEPPE